MSDSAIKMWAATEIGKYVQTYISAGLYVFPVHGMAADGCTCKEAEKCERAGKHPACAHGLKDAVNTMEEAAYLFGLRDDYNIGVACGKNGPDDPGFFVIDVDSYNGGDESLAKLEAELGPLPETPMVLTGGGGKHLVFAFPDAKIGNGVKVHGYPGIDIRTTGGYVVWPPSKHKSGKRYEFAPGFFENDFAVVPPEWQDKLKVKYKKTIDKNMDRDVRGNYVDNPEWSDEEVKRMLLCLDADMPYWDWCTKVGMALHEGGYPFYMWDDWSATSKTKYRGSQDCMYHWQTFNRSGGTTMGTLIDMAQLGGWKPERSERVVNTSVPSVDKYVEKLHAKITGSKPKKEKAPAEPKPAAQPEDAPKPNFSFNPLTLPGPIGDTTRWIDKYALIDQPEMALLNVIAFAGAVFGRKYESPVNTRTNVYMISTARTAGGKGHSRKMIGKMAAESGLSFYMGANSVRSDSGMLRSLMANASQLMMIDEFGIFMQAIADPRAQRHIKEISRAFLMLYSDSASAYHHGDYADGKSDPIKIMCPNLCIYGTTTEDSYTASLKPIAIKNGELNRFIVLPSRQKIVRRVGVPRIEMDDDIKLWWKQFAPNATLPLAHNMNSGNVVPRAEVVQWGECEEIFNKLFDEQVARLNDGAALCDLWGRLYENTLKIAMIFAIARDPGDPKFSMEDYAYAYDIVSSSINYITVLAQDKMSETQHEANHQEVLKFIKRNPKGVTKSHILREFRKFKKKDSEDLIATMLDQELINSERIIPPGGRGGIITLFKPV